jgi:hypothetical protein
MIAEKDEDDELRVLSNAIDVIVDTVPLL